MDGKKEKKRPPWNRTRSQSRFGDKKTNEGKKSQEGKYRREF